MPALVLCLAVQPQPSLSPPFAFRQISLVSPTDNVPFPTTKFKVVLLPPRHPSPDHTLALEPLQASSGSGQSGTRGKVIAQATIGFEPPDDPTHHDPKTEEAITKLIFKQARMVPGFIDVKQNSTSAQRVSVMIFIEKEDTESEEWLGKVDVSAMLNLGAAKERIAAKMGMSVSAVDAMVAVVGLDQILGGASI